MSRNSELVKNTFLISLAQISAQIVNFLLLPVYTAVLSTTEYGKADLYVTLRTILVCVLFLGVEQSIFRFCVSERDVKKKQEYFSTGLVLAAGLMVIFSIIFVSGSIIWKFQYARALYVYYFSYGLFYLLIHIARGMEKTGIYTVATTLGTILMAVFNIIFVVWLRLGIKGVLAGSKIGRAHV